ncbi:MAG: LysM peptidoglycan-binding domain-containing protein [Armatimonadota bacterium]
MNHEAFEPEQDAEVQVTPIRRRPRSRKSVYTRPVDYPRIVLSVMFLAALAAGAGYYIFTNYVVVNAPYAVVLNGKTLVVLRSREDAVQALRLIREEHAPKLPAVVTFVEGEPEIRPFGKASYVRMPDIAAPMLKQHLTPVYDGYGLFVSGQPLALLPSKEDAARTISMMLDRGMAGKHGIPTFKQRVAVDHLRLELEKGQSVLKLPPGETAREMVHPPRPRVHIVDLGDNFWLIATQNGITVDELKALNPGVNYKALHKGDRIKLPDQPSPVTVVVREVKVQQEPITAPPPDAHQPAPEPQNARTTAVNQPPVTTGSREPAMAAPHAPATTDRTVNNRAPSSGDRPAVSSPAPRREPSATRRAPSTPRRQSTRPPAPETRAPRATRPQPETRRPANPPQTHAAPETGSTPKSYTDHRMPLKKNAPDAAPAPDGTGP